MADEFDIKASAVLQSAVARFSQRLQGLDNRSKEKRRHTSSKITKRMTNSHGGTKPIYRHKPPEGLAELTCASNSCKQPEVLASKSGQYCSAKLCIISTDRKSWEDRLSPPSIAEHG